MPAESSSATLATALTRGWTRLTRQITVIGAGILITALAISGAQCAAISASAVGSGGVSEFTASSGGSSISGTVTDTSESPIDGIDVIAYVNTGGQWDGVSQVTTDGTGAYTLGSLAAGSYALQFVSPSNAVTAYLSEYYLDASTAETATLVSVAADDEITGFDAELLLANSIAGHVTNSAGNNLSGIQVTALSYDDSTAEYEEVAWATTDNTGLYTMVGLPDASYVVKFASAWNATTTYQTRYSGDALTAEDATSTSVSQGTNSTGVDAILTLTNTISGVVKDTAIGRVAAKALAGIVVMAQTQYYDAETDYNYYATVSETTTSSTGAYSLTGLPDGEYIIQYSSPDSAPTQYLSEYYNNESTADGALVNFPVDVIGGQVVTVSLTNLAVSATIRGTLTAQGGGVEFSSNDFLIRACGIDGSGWLDCNHGRSIISSGGSYTLTDLPAGSYAVRVFYYGSENLFDEYYSTTTTTAWNDADASFIVLAAGGTATGKNIALNAGGEISGTVSRDGVAVEGSSVTLYEAARDSLYETRSALTDAEGNYTINKLPPGKFSVKVESQWNGGGYSENRAPRLALTVTATTHTSETADFALEAGGSISGNVLDSTELTGIDQAMVTATRYDSATSHKSNEWTYEAFTEPDGQYSFPDLPPGYYGLSYSNVGYLSTQYISSEAPINRVVVVAGQATPALMDVVLQHTGSVSGRVIDADGNPLAHVVVGDAVDWWEQTTSTVTDSDGNYTLDGLDPAVAYTLFFYTGWLDFTGDATYTDTTVALPIGALTSESQTTVLDDTVLIRSAEVTGKVTDSAGVGQVGMTIEALVKYGNADYTVAGSTTTTLGGSYTLTDIPAGAVLYFTSDPFAPAATAKFASQYDGGTTNASLATVLNFSTPGTGIRHDMVLVPIGSITGTVKKGTALMAGISVSAYSVDPDHTNRWTAYGEGVTNAKGVYTIPGLAQGSYTVSFNSRASGASLSGLSETVGQTTAIANVPWNAPVTSNAVLIPTTRVTGTVSGVASNKLSGITVIAYPWTGTVAGEPLYDAGFDTATTDVLGNYRLILTPGKYVLKFVDDQRRVSTRFLGGTSAPVDANKITVAATALSGKNITLVSTGATLTATAVNLDGDLAEGWIELERMNGDAVITSVIAPTSNQQTINHSFPLTNIETGDYQLTIHSSNGLDSDLTVTFTVVGNSVTTYTIGNYEPVTGSNDLGMLTLDQSARDFTEPAVIAGSEPTISMVGESNELVVGSILQANNDSENWSNTEDNFEYQWLRDGRPIAAATGSYYQVTPGDAGTTISLRITADWWSDYTTPATSSVQMGSLDASDLPIITGNRSVNHTVSVGQLLTATPGAYSVTGLSYGYNWLRNETPIAGATASTYSLVTADVGASITVSVTAMRAGYTEDTLVSTGFEGIVPAAVLRRTVALAPTFSAGVYTARPGTWTPTGATFTYQWLSYNGDSVVDDIRTATYPNPADSSLRIVLLTTAHKAGYADTTVETLVRAGTGLAITNTPEMTGTGAVGSPLTVSPTSNHANATFAYQWYRATALIAGATKASYEPITADVGRALRVTIIAKNAGFANSVVVTTNAPTITAANVGSRSEDAAVSGTYAVGRALSVTTGIWSPTPKSFTFKWVRASTSGGAYTNIAGATAASYTLAAADFGKFVKAVVTPVRTGFTYTAFTSNANESPISTQEITNLSAPSIGVLAKVGTALTANPGTWDVAGATFTFQWLINDRIIAGATAATYTPSPETLSDEISVQVWANKTTFPSGAETETYSNQLTVTKGAAHVATAVPTIKVGTSTTVATASTVIALETTLHASSGVWPSGSRSVDYQWQYLSSEGSSSWSDLAGANGDSLYVDGDSRYMIDEYRYRLVVTVRRAGYVDSTAISAVLRLNIP